MSRPAKGLCPPSLDLDKAVRALFEPLYKPLAIANLRALTENCLFLLSHATAQMAGELQTVSCQVGFLDDDLVLSYLPEFVVKT